MYIYTASNFSSSINDLNMWIEYVQIGSAFRIPVDEVVEKVYEGQCPVAPSQIKYFKFP